MRTYKSITAEEFVRLWESSSSLEEVVERAKPATRMAVLVRASAYRRKKVKLKFFLKKPRKDRINVLALNRLIKSIRKERP